MRLPDYLVVLGQDSVAAALAASLRLLQPMLVRRETLRSCLGRELHAARRMRSALIYVPDAAERSPVPAVSDLVTQMRDHLGWTGGLLVALPDEGAVENLRSRIWLFRNCSGHACISIRDPLPDLLLALAAVGKMSRRVWTDLKQGSDRPPVLARLQLAYETLLGGGRPAAEEAQANVRAVLAERPDFIGDVDEWTKHQGTGAARRLVSWAEEDSESASDPASAVPTKELEELQRLLEPFPQWW